ncbi:unnamed protein product [Toxocara canis]|uniref:Clathrin light chain n=1 Tax=Toxocara canis TaxID=6265 RepID=A0A183V7T9_TOXCA|nr:unnamed protein product [Toxocara canis]
MSSSHPPPDCALQLPSWDEFDQTEELDCSESDLVRDQRTADRSTTVGLTLPPGFDAGSSQLRETEERSSIPPDVRHSNQGVASSSFFDQLPNSLPQHFDDQPTSSNATHPLGPTLPPGFVLNSRTGEEDDPEDPGDPEDPDENDSRSKVPSLHCPEGRASVMLPAFSTATSSGRTEQIGPTLPPGFGDFSPSLPDEVRPRSQGRSLSATMPPPEPEETRVSIWSSKPDVAVAASSSRTVIGPAVPDLLPTVSHFENAEEGEEEGEEVYGPAIPPDLDPAQRPSTSNARDDLEMPVDDDEHCVRDDDTSDDNDIIGPMPPCESAEAAEREFKQRLFAYEVQHAQKIPTAKREEWMVKLPKKLHSFGLGARVFSKSGNGILSDQEGSRQWTETPQEKDERLAVCMISVLFFF